MPLTQQQLEKHLWRAADILRGRIDSGDNKHSRVPKPVFEYVMVHELWLEDHEVALA